ncbi:unnamed protein product [Soboliphyme baturini]|uniref:WD_REPEATS_REGION domain-containing protein n=1 Tax=Soboliphyme baturini TaxID=241478 RepID=A0A183J2D7_9BILA|nr:unnamed protein product [Soboliphyme baturini]
MASASKDGTFRVWNTDIQYSLGQEPYLISVGNLDNLKTEPGVLSLSPNGFTVVIACGREIRVFRADTGQLVENLSTVHESAVTAVKFTSDNSLFISSGDRHVRLFHNVANYQISIEKATEQLKFVNAAAHRSRLLDQIKLATQRLSELGCM